MFSGSGFWVIGLGGVQCRHFPNMAILVVCESLYSRKGINCYAIWRLWIHRNRVVSHGVLVRRTISGKH